MIVNLLKSIFFVNCLGHCKYLISCENWFENSNRHGLWIASSLMDEVQIAKIFLILILLEIWNCFNLYPFYHSQFYLFKFYFLLFVHLCFRWVLDSKLLFLLKFYHLIGIKYLTGELILVCLIFLYFMNGFFFRFYYLLTNLTMIIN